MRDIKIFLFGLIIGGLFTLIFVCEHFYKNGATGTRPPVTNVPAK